MDVPDFRASGCSIWPLAGVFVGIVAVAMSRGHDGTIGDVAFGLCLLSLICLLAGLLRDLCRGSRK